MWFLVAILIGFSLLMTLGVGSFIACLPANYFSKVAEEDSPPRRKPALQLLRNLTGALILACGLILVLPVFPLPPGSSACVMLCGILVMDFKGKHSMIRRLVLAPGVFPLLNWTRSKLGSPPFAPPPSSES